MPMRASSVVAVGVAIIPAEQHGCPTGAVIGHRVVVARGRPDGAEERPIGPVPFPRLAVAAVILLFTRRYPQPLGLR